MKVKKIRFNNVLYNHPFWCDSYCRARSISFSNYSNIAARLKVSDSLKYFYVTSNHMDTDTSNIEIFRHKKQNESNWTELTGTAAREKVYDPSHHGVGTKLYSASNDLYSVEIEFQNSVNITYIATHLIIAIGDFFLSTNSLESITIIAENNEEYTIFLNKDFSTCPAEFSKFSVYCVGQSGPYFFVHNRMSVKLIIPKLLLLDKNNIIWEIKQDGTFNNTGQTFSKLLNPDTFDSIIVKNPVQLNINDIKTNVGENVKLLILPNIFSEQIYSRVLPFNFSNIDKTYCYIKPVGYNGDTQITFGD